MGQDPTKVALRKATSISAKQDGPGLIERLIYAISGDGEPIGETAGLVDADKIYLRQFMEGNKKDILPQQPLRPVGQPNERLPFRQSSLPDEFEAYLTVNQEKPSWWPADSKTLTALDGLGNSLRTLGGDAQGHYLSLFDRWDFDSARVNPLVGGIMHMLGKPFAVYDRFDYNPPTKLPTDGLAPVVKARRRKVTK